METVIRIDKLIDKVIIINTDPNNMEELEYAITSALLKATKSVEGNQELILDSENKKIHRAHHHRIKPTQGDIHEETTPKI